MFSFQYSWTSYPAKETFTSFSISSTRFASLTPSTLYFGNPDKFQKNIITGVSPFTDCTFVKGAIALASEKSVDLYNVSDSTPKCSFKSNVEGSYGSAVTLNSGLDGTLLGCGRSTGAIDFYDTHEGKWAHKLAGHKDTGCWIYDVQFADFQGGAISGLGKVVMSAGSDSTVRLWDLRSPHAQCLHAYLSPLSTKIPGVSAAVVQPSAQRLALFGDWNLAVLLSMGTGLAVYDMRKFEMEPAALWTNGGRKGWSVHDCAPLEGRGMVCYVCEAGGQGRALGLWKSEGLVCPSDDGLFPSENILREFSLPESFLSGGGISLESSEGFVAALCNTSGHIGFWKDKAEPTSRWTADFCDSPRRGETLLPAVSGSARNEWALSESDVLVARGGKISVWKPLRNCSTAVVEVEAFGDGQGDFLGFLESTNCALLYDAERGELTCSSIESGDAVWRLDRSQFVNALQPMLAVHSDGSGGMWMATVDRQQVARVWRSATGETPTQWMSCGPWPTTVKNIGFERRDSGDNCLLFKVSFGKDVVESWDVLLRQCVCRAAGDGGKTLSPGMCTCNNTLKRSPCLAKDDGDGCFHSSMSDAGLLQIRLNLRWMLRQIDWVRRFWCSFGGTWSKEWDCLSPKKLLEEQEASVSAGDTGSNWESGDVNTSPRSSGRNVVLSLQLPLTASIIPEYYSAVAMHESLTDLSGAFLDRAPIPIPDNGPQDKAGLICWKTLLEGASVVLPWRESPDLDQALQEAGFVPQSAPSLAQPLLLEGVGWDMYGSLHQGDLRAPDAVSSSSVSETMRVLAWLAIGKSVAHSPAAAAGGMLQEFARERLGSLLPLAKRLAAQTPALPVSQIWTALMAALPSIPSLAPLYAAELTSLQKAVVDAVDLCLSCLLEWKDISLTGARLDQWAEEYDRQCEALVAALERSYSGSTCAQSRIGSCLVLGLLADRLNCLPPELLGDVMSTLLELTEVSSSSVASSGEQASPSSSAEEGPSLATGIRDFHHHCRIRRNAAEGFCRVVPCVQDYLQGEPMLALVQRLCVASRKFAPLLLSVSDDALCCSLRSLSDLIMDCIVEALRGSVLLVENMHKRKKKDHSVAVDFLEGEDLVERRDRECVLECLLLARCCLVAPAEFSPHASQIVGVLMNLSQRVAVSMKKRGRRKAERQPLHRLVEQFFTSSELNHLCESLFPQDAFSKVYLTGGLLGVIHAVLKRFIAVSPVVSCSSPTAGFRFGVDPHILAVGDRFGHIQLFNTLTYRPIKGFKAHMKRIPPPSGPDGRRAFSRRRRSSLMNLFTKGAFTVEEQVEPQNTWEDTPVTFLEFGAAGRVLGSFSVEDCCLKIWDASSPGRLIDAFLFAAPAEGDSDSAWMATAPSGPIPMLYVSPVEKAKGEIWDSPALRISDMRSGQGAQGLQAEPELLGECLRCAWEASDKSGSLLELVWSPQADTVNLQVHGVAVYVCRLRAAVAAPAVERRKSKIFRMFSRSAVAEPPPPTSRGVLELG